MDESPSEDEMSDSSLVFCMEHNLLCAGTAAVSCSSPHQRRRPELSLCGPITKPIHNTTSQHHAQTCSLIYLTKRHQSPLPFQCHMGDPQQLLFMWGWGCSWTVAGCSSPRTLPRGTDCCCCLNASWLWAGGPQRSTRPWWSNLVSYIDTKLLLEEVLLRPAGVLTLWSVWGPNTPV